LPTRRSTPPSASAPKSTLSTSRWTISSSPTPAARAQRLDKIAVEFDRRELARRLQQREGQRAFAGPDLDDAIARAWRYRLDDAAKDVPVVQEVLTEALLRGVRAGCGMREVHLVILSRNGKWGQVHFS